MQRRETYIDRIDNVRRITGYTSYEDYVNRPATRALAAERGITLPTVKKAVLEQETVVTEEKTTVRASVNIGAAITAAIFSILLVAWGIVSLTVTWGIGGGEKAIEIFNAGVWKGERLLWVMLAVAIGLTGVVGVVVRLAALKKGKAAIVVAAFSGVVLGLTIGIALCGMLRGNGLRIGIDLAGAIILAAIAFGAAIGAVNYKKGNR